MRVVGQETGCVCERVDAPEDAQRTEAGQQVGGRKPPEWGDAWPGLFRERRRRARSAASPPLPAANSSRRSGYPPAKPDRSPAPSTDLACAPTRPLACAPTRPLACAPTRLARAPTAIHALEYCLPTSKCFGAFSDNRRVGSWSRHCRPTAGGDRKASSTPAPNRGRCRGWPHTDADLDSAHRRPPRADSAVRAGRRGGS